jgi:hypothetical protein
LTGAICWPFSWAPEAFQGIDRRRVLPDVLGRSWQDEPFNHHRYPLGRRSERLDRHQQRRSWLVVEADTWPAMIEEVRLVLPDLLELSGERSDNLSLTFRAEEHLEVAGA